MVLVFFLGIAGVFPLPPRAVSLMGLEGGVREIFAQLKPVRVVINKYSVQWCPEPV